METQPLLSIITVTYNAEDTIQKTLSSIWEQDFDNYEVIIIDGKSTDNTTNIIEDNQHRIAHIVSEEDAGIYDAMNKGLSLATGKYVQFLNAGDYYCDNTVLKDIFSSASDLSPCLLYGDIKILHTDNRITYSTASSFTLDLLQRYGTGVLCHQAMFVKREIAPRYNCKYKYKAELNWYFDLVESDNFTYKHISRPVVVYALGGFGHSNFLRNRLEWVYLVVRRYGLIVVIKKRLIPFLIKNSTYRYSIMKTVYNIYKACNPSNFCKKYIDRTK